MSTASGAAIIVWVTEWLRSSYHHNLSKQALATSRFIHNTNTDCTRGTYIPSDN
jgi:hypothetical protein